jgi:hypothetical protein
MLHVICLSIFLLTFYFKEKSIHKTKSLFSLTLLCNFTSHVFLAYSLCNLNICVYYLTILYIYLCSSYWIRPQMAMLSNPSQVETIYCFPQRPRYSYF